MTDSGNHAAHLCWQQRVRREAQETMKFSHVVDLIKDKRPDDKKNKPVYPFKVLTPSRALLSSKAKVMLDQSSTNPSDPNSIKDLGPIMYANVQEVNIDDINEIFSETERDNMTVNPELDKEINEDDALKYIEDLKSEGGSNIDTIKTTASKMAERKKMDMVKTLIKRGEGNDDTKSVGSNRSKRSKSSNKLMALMNERLKEE